MTNHILLFTAVVIFVPAVLVILIQIRTKKYIEAALNTSFYVTLETILLSDRAGAIWDTAITVMIISSLGLLWHSVRALKKLKQIS